MEDLIPTPYPDGATAIVLSSMGASTGERYMTEIFLGFLAVIIGIGLVLLLVPESRDIFMYALKGIFWFSIWCGVLILLGLLLGRDTPIPSAVMENRESLNGFIERDAWHVERITTLEAHVLTMDAGLATLQAPTPVPTITPTPTPTPTPTTMPWWYPMFEPTPTEGVVR